MDKSTDTLQSTSRQRQTKKRNFTNQSDLKFTKRLGDTPSYRLPLWKLPSPLRSLLSTASSFSVHHKHPTFILMETQISRQLRNLICLESHYITAGSRLYYLDLNCGMTWGPRINRSNWNRNFTSMMTSANGNAISLDGTLRSLGMSFIRFNVILKADTNSWEHLKAETWYNNVNEYNIWSVSFSNTYKLNIPWNLKKRILNQADRWECSSPELVSETIAWGTQFIPRQSQIILMVFRRFS